MSVRAPAAKEAAVIVKPCSSPAGPLRYHSLIPRRAYSILFATAPGVTAPSSRRVAPADSSVGRSAALSVEDAMRRPSRVKRAEMP